MEAGIISLPILVGLIVVALAFDFLNGLHDAANSIATIVSTRVLRPHMAVAWAAFFNFIAFLFFGLHVAETLGVGIVSADVIDARVIFGALVGAISWNLITWAYGIPSSSSHALIGGLIGAGVAKAGTSSVVVWGVAKTAAAIVLSPLLGFVLALFLMLIVSWLFIRATPYAVDNLFRSLQFVSASLYSLGHGGNDAQKTMGIIAVLLFSQGMLGSEFYVPFWVVITCQLMMGLGTLAGGWRIVKTMGSKITRLTPVQGFCAETGRCNHAVRGNMARNSCFHDPYDYRLHYRRRGGQESVGGTMGRRAGHRVRLDHHDAGVGVDCRYHLFRGRYVRIGRQGRGRLR